MKLKYATAYTDNNDIDNNLKYSIDQDRQVESRRFIEIVEGRLEEIVENAWYQVPSEYYDKLLGGIILTGGGANLKNIERAFHNHTHVDKIRVAKAPVQAINGGGDDIKSKNGMMNTVLGLLLKGDVNCAGYAIDQHGDLFEPVKPSGTQEINDQRPARKPGDVRAGVVVTEAEKQKAEEEARLKAEEEARQKAEEERLRKEEEERIRRENSKWNKFKKGAMRFVKGMVEADE
jgi:cell division protein FtsA